MSKKEIMDFGMLNFLLDKIRLSTQFEFQRRYTKLSEEELAQSKI